MRQRLSRGTLVLSRAASTAAPTVTGVVTGTLPASRVLRGWSAALLSAGLSLLSLWELAGTWSTHPYGAHGIFVPVLSALMLWSRRDQLRSERGGSAGVLVSAAIVLSVVAYATRSPLAHAVTVVVASAGIVLCLRGAECLRQAAFPLGFLFFMLPLPMAFVDLVTLDLQQFVARVASTLLEVGGVPVHQQGLLLRLPGISVHIDEGCNGLRFLMVLLVVVIAFAYMYLPRTDRRLVAIMAALPVGILANAVRVTAIAAATQLVGPRAASGWIHDYVGRSVWLVAISVMLGFVILLGQNKRQERWDA